jgi:hypothetical protein
VTGAPASGAAAARHPGKLSLARCSARFALYVRISIVSNWRGAVECQTFTA